MEKVQVVQVVGGRVTAPAAYSVVEAAQREAARREAAVVPGLVVPGLAVPVSRQTAGAEAEAVCSAAGPAAVHRAAGRVEMVPVAAEVEAEAVMAVAPVAPVAMENRMAAV